MEFPTTLYRECLIAHMNAAGISVAELARRTGVSETKIYKLHQRKTIDTTVTDAVKMARFFGKNMEEFMGLAASNYSVSELMLLIGRLTPEQIVMLEAQINGILLWNERADKA